MSFLTRLPLFVVLMGIASASMLIPAVVANVQDTHHVARAFFYGAILGGVFTALVGLATLDRRSRYTARSQLLTLVAAFSILPLLLALPMREAVRDASFFNIYFEMVSSLTTTGATLFETPGRLPDALHLWRALVGWMGGFLILLAGAAILAPMNLGGFEVLRPNMASQRADHTIQRIAPDQRLIRMAQTLFPIYLGATLVLWLGLFTTGTGAFNALCLAMSTLATSGIIPPGAMDQTAIRAPGELLILIFLCFAISRRSYNIELGRAYLSKLVDDRETRIAVIVAITVAFALFFRHWIGAFDVDEEKNLTAALRALWGAIFTIVSYLTTTGFASHDWEAARSWSGLPTPGLILAGLAIIGGGVATTAGGVKLLRVYVLYKHGLREMERLIHPRSVGREGRLGREVRREGAFVAWIFFMLFALSIAAVIVALTLTGLNFDATIAFAISALSTTGPLAEIALDGALNYADLGVAAKSILMVAMVLGRLETLAIVALFNPEFWRA